MSAMSSREISDVIEASDVARMECGTLPLDRRRPLEIARKGETPRESIYFSMKKKKNSRITRDNIDKRIFRIFDIKFLTFNSCDVLSYHGSLLRILNDAWKIKRAFLSCPVAINLSNKRC